MKKGGSATDGVMLIGSPDTPGAYPCQVHCVAKTDTGTASNVYGASLEVKNSSSVILTAASWHRMDTAVTGTEAVLREVWGLKI